MGACIRSNAISRDSRLGCDFGNVDALEPEPKPEYAKLIMTESRFCKKTMLGLTLAENGDVVAFTPHSEIPRFGSRPRTRTRVREDFRQSPRKSSRFQTNVELAHNFVFVFDLL
jgi:hypothetical protein